MAEDEDEGQEEAIIGIMMREVTIIKKADLLVVEAGVDTNRDHHSSTHLMAQEKWRR